MICSSVFGGVRLAGTTSAARFVVASPALYGSYDQQRNMATLKEVKARIKSVSSIQKITKSMKLVATTRLKKAEEAFKMNKPSYDRLEDFLTEFKADAAYNPDDEVQAERKLVMPLTTERGLCGSVNSSVNRLVRGMNTEFKEKKQDVQFVLLGNKAAQGLARECGSNTPWSAKDLGGRNGPKFIDVLPVAERVVDLEYDRGTIVRNQFVNLLTFNTLESPTLSRNLLTSMVAPSYEYDSGSPEDTLKNFHEWYTAVSLYSYLSETHCIEIGQRMTSMDNATKNAGDLIKKLTRQFNRRRQAQITTEITEIVSGAAAVDEGT